MMNQVKNNQRASGATGDSDFMLVSIRKQRSHVRRYRTSQLDSQDRPNAKSQVRGSVGVRHQHQRQGWKPGSQEQVQKVGLSGWPAACWNFLE